MRNHLIQPPPSNCTLLFMDAFADRYLPIEGRTFLSRSGTWRCELGGPVDVSGVDRRIFYLEFNLTTPDLRWNHPTARQRRLELRTSLDGDSRYAGLLLLVIKGFLDSEKTEDIQEVYEVKRVLQS